MNRIPEIDYWRGLTVIAMVLFNWSFALKYFQVAELFPGSWGYWWLFPRLIAASFLLLVGVSLTLSFGARGFFRKQFIRGSSIFALGLLVTLVTWVFVPEEFIFFGILHLIGVGVIAGALLVKKPALSLFLGLALIASSFFVDLSFRPSLDYFPPIPWLGFIFLGVFLASTLYADKTPLLGLKESPWLKFLSSNSLKVYLLHQPLLILALHLIGVKVI